MEFSFEPDTPKLIEEEKFLTSPKLNNRLDFKLYLLKPDFTLIQEIYHYNNLQITKQRNGLANLQFSVPLDIPMYLGTPIETIKSHYIIKAKSSYEELFFLVLAQDISISPSEKKVSFDIMEYPRQLASNIIVEYKEKSKTIKTLFQELLSSTNSSWKLDYIDPDAQLKYRSYEFQQKTLLEIIQDVAERFNLLIRWNSKAKTFGFYKPENFAVDKGLILSEEKYLKGLNFTINSEEIITQLYLLGAEDMSIRSISPVGSPYLEDYSWFMHPFQEEGGQVIQHSDYMSDSLCFALISLNKKVEQNKDKFQQELKALEKLAEKEFMAWFHLSELETQLETLLDRLDVLNSTEGSTDKEIQDTIQKKRKKEAEVKDAEKEHKKIQRELKDKENVVARLQWELSKEKNLTKAQIEELDNFTITKIMQDSTIEDPEDLFEVGQEVFKDLQVPEITATVELKNFLQNKEYQLDWNKLELGDLIRIQYQPANIELFAQITTINYDISGNDISIELSNENTYANKNFTDQLYDSIGTSTIVGSDKYKWDLAEDAVDGVSQILNNKWDAAKQMIQGGVNQTVTISERGLIIESSDDPLSLLVAQNGVLGLSKDGGETWKTAITPDGVYAEHLVGKIIMGNRLHIEDEDGIIRIEGNKQTIFDKEGNPKVILGEYKDGQFGIQIDSGALEILGNMDLSLEDLNPDVIKFINGKEYDDSKVWDEFGRNREQLEKYGVSIDKHGNLLDEYGYQITEQATYIEKQEKEIQKNQIEINKQGELIDSQGRVISEQGREIIARDTKLREQLNLEAPLPTNLQLDENGITAYTKGSDSSFARMDYRGLYVQGGAIDIRTDGSATSRGLIFNSKGIKAYNNNGLKTFEVDTNGNITLRSGSLNILGNLDIQKEDLNPDLIKFLEYDDSYLINQTKNLDDKIDKNTSELNQSLKDGTQKLQDEINGANEDIKQVKEEIIIVNDKTQKELNDIQLGYVQMDKTINSHENMLNNHSISLTTQGRLINEQGQEVSKQGQKIIDVDTKLRDDLRLTDPLPTSLALNTDGITAYTRGNTSSFARLDHRGLYIQGGAIDIRTNGKQTNRGITMSSSGFRAYNRNGLKTFEVDTNGNITLRGGSLNIIGNLDIQKADLNPELIKFLEYDDSYLINKTFDLDTEATRLGMKTRSLETKTSELDTKTDKLDSNVRNLSRDVSSLEGQDRRLRNDLRLTGSLPTSLALNTNGITAYTSGNTSSFARLDYRGLYVQGGAIDIRTNGSYDNRGVVIDSTGISGYDSFGRLTFELDQWGNLTASKGNFSGDITGATGTFTGSLNTGDNVYVGKYLYLKSLEDDGGIILNQSYSDKGEIFLTSQYIGGSSRTRIVMAGRIVRLNSNTGGIELASKSGKVVVDAYRSTKAPHIEFWSNTQNWHTGTISFGNNGGEIESTGARIRMGAGRGDGVNIQNKGGREPAPIRASAFNQVSDVKEKKDLDKYDTAIRSALQEIQESEIYRYRYKSENEEAPKSLGLLLHEAPDNIQTEQAEEKSINLYSMISLAWVAIQELSEINKQLEDKIIKLETTIKGEKVDEI